jgi:uncharacterized protein YigE (DUF2233 family)
MYRFLSRTHWLFLGLVTAGSAGTLWLHGSRPAAATAPPAAASKSAVRATVKVLRTTSVKRAGKARPTSATAYRKVVVRGIPMHVVQIDPRRPEVRLGVATSGKGLGYRDDWSRMIDRTRPAAAITGTYFCTTTFLPVGLIRVSGANVYRGGIGTALAFTPGKGAEIKTCKPGIGYDWAGYETVLRAGPRLLTGGKRTLFPEAEGFRDPAVYAPKTRTAVAITHSGKLLLVAVPKPVRLRTLAELLRELGAKDAMCLDGGGSTALFHRGKTHIDPNRPLTNLLVVYDSRSRWRMYSGRLNPNGPTVAKTDSSAG